MPAERYDREIADFPGGRLTTRENKGVRWVLKKSEFNHEISRKAIVWIGYASATLGAAIGAAKWLLPHIKV